MPNTASVDRWYRWVAASRGLEAIEPFMIVIAQGLGRMDLNLITGDAELLSSLTALSDPAAAMLQSERLTNGFTQSYLWVLGAYELLRVIDERIRYGNNFTEVVIQAAQEVKQSFARIRMPLAKLEPAHRFRATDSALAYPILHAELGVAWRIGPQKFVIRRTLSDQMLEFLELLTQKSNQIRDT